MKLTYNYYQYQKINFDTKDKNPKNSKPYIKCASEIRLA